MPDPHTPADRSPEQRVVDHASLERLSETLVPALVQKLSASGLGELEVREGTWHIRLRRPVAAAASGPARRGERPWMAPHAAERDGRTGREASPPAPGAIVADDADEPRRVLAVSPAVGVFRPGVQVGARLRAGDRIGIVDLLGIPQDVVSPVDGTLAEILVPGGEAVEYGEAIAAVDPAADPGPGDPGDPATAGGGS